MKYQNIFLTIITSLLTVLLTYGGYTIYADNGGSDKTYATNCFGEAEKLKMLHIFPEDQFEFEKHHSFSTIECLYHELMNNFFNEKIEAVRNEINEGNFDTIKVPEDIEVDDDFFTIIDKCGTENLSAYCVSMHALHKYLAYVEKLNTIINKLELEGIGDAYVASIQNIVMNVSERNQKIIEEFDNARLVMEATVGAYNEFQTAYPLHRKYRKVMVELIKYKNILNKARRELIDFPQKFHNASTKPPDQCT